MEDDALYRAFRAYASFGDRGAGSKGLMDSSKFAKLCRETGVVDGSMVTRTDVDLIFTKTKDRGARRIDYDQFCVALAQLAARRFPGAGSPAEAFAALADTVAQNGDPAVHGATEVAAGGIYDKLTDVRLYTGSHRERFDGTGRGRGLAGRDSVAKGGGSSMGVYEGGEGVVHDLSAITRRDLEADVRGVVSPRTSSRSRKTRRRRESAGVHSNSSFSAPASASPRGGDPSQSVPSDPAELARALYMVFLAFAQFGGVHGVTDIDSARFSKLARECDLCQGPCTPTDVDLIFMRCKERGKRRLDFAQFQAALALIGEKLFPDMAPDESFHRVVAAVVAAGGPALHATAPDTHGIYSKLTDSSLYTGAHRERFDREGHGRGIEGRTMRTHPMDLSDIADRDRKADIRGVIH